MNHREARQQLIEYIADVLRVTVKPNEPVAVSLEAIAEFCDLLREGCQQDVVRLIKQVLREDFRSDLDSITGREALEQFGMTMNEGADPKLWGLPSCECGRVDCVYCGRRIA